MANADNPHDAKVAVDFGAEGIGLCRTEHMFFEEDRILSMREMIIASNEKERRTALDKLLPHQVSDFVGIFKVMEDKPVIIRLLDPPLHEFLPKTEQWLFCPWEQPHPEIPILLWRHFEDNLLKR